MKNHFFLMKTHNSERKYAPETKMILDIPSAVNIFAPDGIPELLDTIRGKIDILCADWNYKFGDEAIPPPPPSGDCLVRFRLILIQISCLILMLEVQLFLPYFIFFCFTFLIQTPDKTFERGCIQEILPIAKHEFPSWNGVTPRDSRLVMILSNYSWVRQHQKNTGPLRCKPEYFTVQIKMHSSVFKPYAEDPDDPNEPNDFAVATNDANTITYSSIPDSQEKFFFDSHGICLQLEDFCSLCLLPAFTFEFMTQVESLLTRHAPPPRRAHVFTPDVRQMPPLPNKEQGNDETGSSSLGLRKRNFFTAENFRIATSTTKDVETIPLPPTASASATATSTQSLMDE